ncbi:hypothetical protein P154DRAFT_616410 [Amniculicola lignicola CBS 123094]|uniref:Protein kinase domain-containing protein n=1 Tax=Amniculicola lignicola CBS 123094 TaxID=1392246 RepID=A0A6A5WU89_9PLEO|nr:hypothetical protein P154DRAFT_616410 [Amniculicola lignicola CBS 123094]
MADDGSVPASAPNNNNSGLIFSRQSCPYNNVGVLALYWQQDDFQPSCQKESQKIVSLFRDEFHYNVEEFPISSEADKCEDELAFAISRFKCEYNSMGNLMIVYYSGHGDRDRTNNKAIWAAQKVGGATVDWYLIQPQLMHAKADVLLVFDCCYASSAAKARDDLEGGVELLAASPSGGQTPQPGDSSFTHFFVQEIRQQLRDKGEVRVGELTGSIFKQTSQDPVHLILRGTSRISILLRPLSLSAPGGGQQEQEFTVANSKGALTLTMLIKSPPDDQAIQELGNWIKSSAPPNVMTVRVDQVVSQSNGFLDFLLEENQAGTQGRLLDHMRQEDKGAVLATLQSIAKLTAAPHTSLDMPAANQVEIEAILADWEWQIQKLSSRVWSILKAHPEFQEATKLEQLERNKAAAKAGITAAAKLQLLSRDLRPLPQGDVHFWPRREVKYTKLLKETDRYVTCSINGQPRIIEIIQLSTKEKALPLCERKAAIKKVISLLSSPLPEQFHVCKCAGFTAETDGGQGWYGLVFEFPRGTDTLAPLKSMFKKIPRMPLERRYRMAYRLAQTIMALQSIGWVHKGARSENMLFLSSKSSPDRLTNHEAHPDDPWLFGFEHAREESDNTRKEVEFRLERMIYTPPSRWGTPQEKFSYSHDVYALGVLLLELGYWKPILSIKRELRNVASADEAHEILIGVSRGEDLAHLMGSPYAQIVQKCLTDRNYHNDTLPQFQRLVLDTLERLAVNTATRDVLWR